MVNKLLNRLWNSCLLYRAELSLFEFVMCLFLALYESWIFVWELWSLKMKLRGGYPGFFFFLGALKESLSIEIRWKKFKHTFYGTNSSYDGDRHSKEGHQHDVTLWCGPIGHFSYSPFGIWEWFAAQNTYRAGPPVPTSKRYRMVDAARWDQAATEPMFMMSSARSSGFNMDAPLRARPPKDVSMR